MSYTHIHLPELSELKNIIEELPSKIIYYKKYDGFIGSSESIEYIKYKIKNYDENQSNS